VDFVYFTGYRSDTAGSFAETYDPVVTNSNVDDALTAGTDYYYAVTAFDAKGIKSFQSAEVSTAALAMAEGRGIPNAFALGANYPNPSNPTTTLRFDLPAATYVRIVIYDLMGCEVARLVDRRLETGYRRVVWSGRDSPGRDAPTGMYIAGLVTPGYTRSIKMVLLK